MSTQSINLHHSDHFDNPELTRIWSDLEGQFMESQHFWDEESLTRVIGLLQHLDIGYVRQGLDLLLTFGEEQLCHCVDLIEGELVLKHFWEHKPLLEQALLEVIPTSELFKELDGLGAFDSMFMRFWSQYHLSEMSDELQKRLVQQSKKMMHIPAGNFWMGALEGDSHVQNAERPAHLVTLTRDFLVGKYPVTQLLWESIMESNPSSFAGGNRPVENVSWSQCIEFCNKLSIKEGLEPVYRVEQQGDRSGLEQPFVHCDWNANGYRLLTEAEWEYAAKSGQNCKYAGSEVSDEVGWHRENSGDLFDAKTHPVGLKKANAFGLCDMSGNVFEWCWDWYGEHYSEEAQTDPVGPKTGINRIRRGGAWDVLERFARVTNRHYFAQSRMYSNQGFRLAHSIL